MTDRGNSKSIYVTIVEKIKDDIVCGKLMEEQRLPSVRDYAVQLQVNPNTVMRAYDKLYDEEIIYIKRGIGYFVAKGAVDSVLASMRVRFFHEDMPEMFRQLRMLGVSPQELKSDYAAWLEENEEKQEKQ